MNIVDFLELVPYKYGNVSIEAIPYSMTRIGRAMTSRTLIYFPIVHSQTDMGGLSDSVRKVTLQKLGERVWRQKVNLSVGSGAKSKTSSIPFLFLMYKPAFTRMACRYAVRKSISLRK